MGTLNYSGVIESFLENYFPENSHFTSPREIELVEKHLGIKGKTIEELQELRNRIVRCYDELLETEVIYDLTGQYSGRTNKYWDYMNALQSVTAVIDNNIYKY